MTPANRQTAPACASWCTDPTHATDPGWDFVSDCEISKTCRNVIQHAADADMNGVELVRYASNDATVSEVSDPEIMIEIREDRLTLAETEAFAHALLEAARVARS